MLAGSGLPNDAEHVLFCTLTALKEDLNGQ
jgi:hypothetical protein